MCQRAVGFGRWCADAVPQTNKIFLAHFTKLVKPPLRICTEDYGFDQAVESTVWMVLLFTFGQIQAGFLLEFQDGWIDQAVFL